LTGWVGCMSSNGDERGSRWSRACPCLDGWTRRRTAGTSVPCLAQCKRAAGTGATCPGLLRWHGHSVGGGREVRALVVVAQSAVTIPGSVFVTDLLVVMRVHVADPGPNRDHRQEEHRGSAADKDVCRRSQTDASKGVSLRAVAPRVNAPVRKGRNGAGQLAPGGRT
jgi:hypothetical protein